MASPYVWDQATSTWITASAAGVAVSPLTTKGDVWGYSTTDARIPVGADGDVLTADSTQALGLKWAAGGGSGVSSLDSITGAVTLVAGSNVTITDNSPSAGDITIAASGSGAGLVQLFDQTLASAAASIDTGAGGVAGGYSHLYIELYVRSAYASTNDAVSLRFNNDTGTNYDVLIMRNNGGTIASASGFGVTTATAAACPAASATANYFGTSRVSVPSYGITTAGYKTFESTGGYVTSTLSNSQQFNTVAAWRNTAAVTRIAAYSNNGANLVTGSRMTIYGMV